MKFGFAQTVITPEPQTVFLDGFGERITPAEGVRDDLYVKVMVIESGDFRYALAVFDACGFEQRIVSGIKRRIAMENELSPEFVTICTTHTHSAPASGVLGDLPVNYFWWDDVGETAARTVREAFLNAESCRISLLEAEALSYLGNRRGKESCDKSIRVCGFYDKQENIKGILTLAACHATCYSGMTISADYPAVLTRLMEQRYPGAPALFLQGRGADVDPILPDSLNDEERIECLGGELAAHVFTALSREPSCEDQPVRSPSVRTCKLMLPMQPYPVREELLKAISFFEKQRQTASDVFGKRRVVREIYWHQKALQQTPSENTLCVELQALKFSEKAVFLFLPFEVFSETGALIEAYCAETGYDPRFVFVVGHANGTNGYLVPESEFSLEDYESHNAEYWYQKTLLADQLGVEEITFGHYEVINAPHWYDLPQCSRQSEPAVLRGIQDLLSAL